MNTTPKEIFIRGAWELIPKEGNVADVHAIARQPLTDDHNGDHGEVIRRMLAAGVSASDIARLRRIEAYWAVVSMLVYFGSPQSYMPFQPGEREMWWRLQAVDIATDEVVADIDAPYQEFLEEDDSTGRSMRPPRRGT
jgi:hypothetical protein